MKPETQEIIKAWLEGKKVQMKYPQDTDWTTLASPKEVIAITVDPTRFMYRLHPDSEKPVEAMDNQELRHLVNELRDMLKTSVEGLREVEQQFNGAQITIALRDDEIRELKEVKEGMYPKAFVDEQRAHIKELEKEVVRLRKFQEDIQEYLKGFKKYEQSL